MHVIVVGCGRVGSELAVRMDRDGHTVVVLDKDPHAFVRLPEPWDGQTVVLGRAGGCRQVTGLSRAGLEPGQRNQVRFVEIGDHRRDFLDGELDR